MGGLAGNVPWIQPSCRAREPFRPVRSARGRVLRWQEDSQRFTLSDYSEALLPGHGSCRERRGAYKSTRGQ